MKLLLDSPVVRACGTPVTQQSEGSGSCGFAISGAVANTTISGPDEIVSLVHIVEQPDSPTEIVDIDFKDSWVSAANERRAEGGNSWARRRALRRVPTT